MGVPLVRDAIAFMLDRTGRNPQCDRKVSQCEQKSIIVSFMMQPKREQWRVRQLALKKKRTKLAKYKDIVPAKTVIGSSVVNADYEDLGRIEDLVLDASAGRIAYAALSFGGFLGLGDSILPSHGTGPFGGKAGRTEWPRF